ncbi:MAG: MFS transporter [Proteobacteria bacterium]|nr:MFS transporter [Pseudomonadota bacterium]MCP4920098.1 MFS transporter [Pseudomonadota bacterium]
MAGGLTRPTLVGCRTSLEMPHMTTDRLAAQKELFGHPTGLFTLFFAEMWERFSYYGMRALLIFYMIKGFLSYSDNEAYAVYGAYTALVYATPFIGGILADKLLGARKAVIIGGALMASGHLLMTLENESTFFMALALLIVGNGFFKPNISTMVGSLYPDGSGKKDAGFTLFYMGINLGAAMSPLLCGYIGETYGWHYGFGLATVGMLVGLAVFWAPSRLAQMLIGLAALVTAGGMFIIERDPISLSINVFVGLALLASATAAVMALNKGGLPDWAGEAPAKTNKKYEFGIYGALVLVVPLIALLVGQSELAGIVLSVFGVVALGFLLVEAFRSKKVARERLFVVFILMFFSMLFWAFFEQAGSSVSNFTDRNVDRVVEVETVTPEMVGTTVTMDLNQEWLGRKMEGESLYTLSELDAARTEGGGTATREVKVTADMVGMGLGGTEIRASKFQAANPIFILLFGLGFSWLWGFLGARKMEPNIPVKFGLGLLQLGLGFAVLYYGASNADDRGMTTMAFLLLGYLLHTTGELCLSPVGLSMVTKLSPKRIVSTVMGAWFLATAFSSYLAGLIAQLTGVEHGGDGESLIPAPQETVGIYGDVFGKIAIAAVISAFIILAISPLLKKWMHTEVLGDGEGPEDGAAEQKSPEADPEALKQKA